MSSALPLVSVIIPAYNAEKYISEALTSILNQTYQNWEVIFLDDGSIDKTFAIAQSFAKKDSRIYAIQQPNAGASAARNRAFEQSKGDFVKYFDADDLLNPEAIEAQVNLALKNPGCIISGKWGRFYNNDLSTFKLSPESVWRDMNGVDWIIESWSKGPNMTQPGIFLIPRGMVEKLGGWDENLSLLDDMEMYTRLILNSPNVVFCEHSVLYYRSGITGRLSASKSLNAIKSAITSVQKSVKYLLEKNSDQQAKKAAANQIQSLLYSYYIDYPGMAKTLEKEICELGGSSYLLPGGPFRRWLAQILGWKKAIRIHHWYEKLRGRR